jgi:hypothetical protein
MAAASDEPVLLMAYCKGLPAFVTQVLSFM